MLKPVMFTLLLAVSAGCVGTPFEVETSSGGSSTGTVGGTSTGTSTGSASGASATGRELTTAGASSGTSSGAPATTGGNRPSTTGSTTGGETSTGSTSGGMGSSSAGSSSGGSTSGGSTTGGATLAQACTDYIDGENSVETCVGGGPQGPTIEQCEVILAVCTAADDVIIDGMGQCLLNLVCTGILVDDVNNAIACEGPASTLSQACQNAGDTPPDGGPEDPDAGGGEGTTGGATGG